MPVVHRRRMLSRSSASQIGVVRPVLPRIPNVYVPLRKTASKWLGLAVTSFGLWDFKMMRDEIVIDEKRMRAEFEKMDAAFCTAMLNAMTRGRSTVQKEFAKNRAHDGRSFFWPIDALPCLGSRPSPTILPLPRGRP